MEGKPEMLLSPRKNGLTSLFKEVTPFKGENAWKSQTSFYQTSATSLPKAGHNKAGRSDFRKQRLEPDTGTMQERAEGLSQPRKKTRVWVGSTEPKRGKGGKCGHENAENARDWL